MAGNSDKKRAQRQAKRAAKQKRKKAEAKKRALQAQPTSPPPDHDDALSALLASYLGQDPTSAFLANAMNASFPPWACASLYTPAAAQRVLDSGSLPGMTPPHPFVRAKLAAAFDAPRPYDLTWSRAATVEQLFDTLAQLGIPTDEPAFRAAATGRASAWDLGVHLAREATVDALDDVPAAEVAGSVATSLWRQLCPDLPCHEALCDHMQLCYPAGQREDGAEVARHAHQVRAILDALHPGATLAELERELPTLQTLGNWLGDTSSWLWNHALGDPSATEDYLAWIRWRRALEDDHEAVADEADALALVGRRDEGVEMLQAALDEAPMEPGLYARLSDLLSWARDGAEPRLAEAIAVLELAAQRGVDGRDWDLDARLAYLREQAAAS